MIKFAAAGHSSVLPNAPSSPSVSPMHPMHTASGKDMGQPSERNRRMSAIRPTDVGERTCRFLRGMYPARTADCVAADLHTWGVKASTVSKMLERMSAPGALLWSALICVYGPDFLSAVLPSKPRWLDDAHRAEKQREIDAKIAALEAERGAL